MTSSIRYFYPSGIVLILTACTTSNPPPLMFGDQASFGLHLGNDNASGGAAISLGYKHRSIAVVPVSALTKQGVAAKVAAHSDQTNDSITDALSVFAVFEGSTASESTEPVARLGQVFSTGLAAQMVTRGYDCRARLVKDCKELRDPARPPKATGMPALGNATMVDASDAEGAEGVRVKNDPYQRPLVFMRNDIYGFEIGASVAGQGGEFTLGYSSRNVALIPVVLTDAHGNVSRLLGDGQGDGLRDAYSVMGQFRSDTRTRSISFGLERYFATGIAAQNLGSGLQAQIAASGGQKGTTASPQASTITVQPRTQLQRSAASQ